MMNVSRTEHGQAADCPGSGTPGAVGPVVAFLTLNEPTTSDDISDQNSGYLVSKLILRFYVSSCQTLAMLTGSSSLVAS